MSSPARYAASARYEYGASPYGTDSGSGGRADMCTPGRKRGHIEAARVVPVDTVTAPRRNAAGSRVRCVEIPTGYAPDVSQPDGMPVGVERAATRSAGGALEHHLPAVVTRHPDRIDSQSACAITA